MRRTASSWRACVANAAALSLIHTSMAPIVAQAPKASGARPAAAASPIYVPPDGGWPRRFETADGGTLLLYQPQIDSWDRQTDLVARAAVSYMGKEAKTPALGTVTLKSTTSVSLQERLVSLPAITLTDTHFVVTDREVSRQVAAAVSAALPKEPLVLGLDRVLANIEKGKPKPGPAVKSDPPAIFSSTRAAIVVNFDGKPVMNLIDGVDLKFAVNTNWDVFQDGAGTWYLRNQGSWLTSPSLDKGWKAAGSLPASFSKLPNDDNWKEVRGSLPGQRLSADQTPTVFVSESPAELILLSGAPNYLLVEGTDLLWVSNTESDLFRLRKGGPFYYLVAGRWFAAPDLKGPWTFATPSLPDDFKKIPVDHQRSRVLASVPGTNQAAEAVLLAQIPKTARVNKAETKAPEVTYQGEPSFKPIDGTQMSYAANASNDIIKVGDLYYMCFQAVWFVSSKPQGPWEVTSSLPSAITTIPPSSPVHHVTYVTVQESAPADPWVTFAYVAGYTSMMVAYGCVVWGTGYYYQPYVYYGGRYPVYYPYAHTYGAAAWYNPYTGTYGRGAAAYGPYGGAGVGAAYNPRTGTYARGAAAYGPYGSRSFAEAYNPRTGTYAQSRQGSNVYGNWGSSSVQRGDDWARSGHVSTARGTTGGVRTSEGKGALARTGPNGSGFVAGERGGDMYAGRDGNVYKRNDGQWQQYGDGGWSNVDSANRPTPQSGGTRDRQSGTAAQRPAQTDRGTVGQLDRDASARREGQARMRSQGTYRSGAGGRASAGSYGGGGGRARGGGGGRRR
jgi:hypothetical protein